MRWWRSDDHGGDTRVVLLLLNYEESYLSRWLELRHCTRQNCRVKSEGCGAVDIIFYLSNYRTFVGINHFHGARCANVSAGSQVLTSIPFPSFTYLFLYIPFRKNRNKRMTSTSGGCHHNRPTHESTRTGDPQKTTASIAFSPISSRLIIAAWYYDDETKEEEAECT